MFLLLYLVFLQRLSLATFPASCLLAARADFPALFSQARAAARAVSASGTQWNPRVELFYLDMIHVPLCALPEVYHDMIHVSAA